MSEVFSGMVTATDNFLAELMNGVDFADPAGGWPTLALMLSGGAWVSPATGSNVSVADTSKLLKNDLIQRGINLLWSGTKTWVTFVDLNDDAQQTKCWADTNGWQASKYCADGGVYYLYFFKETGNLNGYVTYPYGADQMSGQTWGLNPSVSHRAFDLERADC